GVIAAVEQGKPRVVVPIQNLEEASLVPGARPIGVRNFGDLANHLGIEPAREVVYPDSEPLAMPAKTSLDAIDMAEVYGQFEGRLALEVAAAGGHNIFFL
ncbi:ATP-binding protein, partial [Aerococcus urinae]